MAYYTRKLLVNRAIAKVSASDQATQIEALSKTKTGTSPSWGWLCFKKSSTVRDKEVLNSKMCCLFAIGAIVASLCTQTSLPSFGEMDLPPPYVLLFDNWSNAQNKALKADVP